MSLPLLKKLIDRGIITQGTEIDIRYRGMDIARNATVPTIGTFIVQTIEGEGEALAFQAASVIDGRLRRVQATEILKIDGMEPVRLGQNYGISAAGDRIPQGKRRGRKPKNPRPEEDTL
jgi:hypothetical protein